MSQNARRTLYGPICPVKVQQPSRGMARTGGEHLALCGECPGSDLDAGAVAFADGGNLGVPFASFVLKSDMTRWGTTVV